MRKTSLKRFINYILIVIILVSQIPTPVMAQQGTPPATAAPGTPAETLAVAHERFDTGLALIDQHKWTEALGHLDTAYLYYLAINKQDRAARWHCAHRAGRI